MKNNGLMIFLVLIILLSNMNLAQSIIEDFKPSPTVQPGREFPQVNSEGRVRVSILAPEAKRVQLDISAVKYDLKKNADNTWIGESGPQDEGFHYYQIWVDGAAVPDPGSLYFYGAGRWGSGIEIPANDKDFYEFKNVSHGNVCEQYYLSKITKNWRRCFVYTPPAYNENTSTRFPVLYLQHGSFEDETGWRNQGFANLILDNLISEEKALPMIIVMDNGYAFEELPTKDKKTPPKFVFEDVLIKEIIPMIDSTYRTFADREHRAMAGLSMGANQTIRITMYNLDKFSYIGGFSGTSNYPSSDKIDRKTFMNGIFKDGNLLNEKIKLFWLGLGTKEPNPFLGSVRAFRKMLDEAGIKHVYYESPKTAHEWLTWRRSLYQFAQLLFK